MATPSYGLHAWYSYAGNTPVEGSANGQDLSSPGSCLKHFYPNAAAKCYGPSFVTITKNTISAHGYGQETTTIQVVAPCVRDPILILVHSQSTSYPPCPRGWRSAWSGYSYVEVSRNQSHSVHIQYYFFFFSSISIHFSFYYTVGCSVDLGKSGSCLPYHESKPVMGCTNDKCALSKPKSYWLSTRYLDEGPRHGYNRYGTISRCRVCYK